MVQRFFNSVQRLVDFAKANYDSGRSWEEVSVPVEWNVRMQVRDYKPQNISFYGLITFLLASRLSSV
jgi:hypothetical protein